MKRRLNPKAFSLIELLVVVGLIAILSTMTVIGIGKLQTNSRRQQTRLLFQNLQAMYSDFDANRRLSFGIGHLYQSSTSLTNAEPNLWLACPQSVSTGADDRTGIGSAQAVPITRNFMAMLLAFPNAAASIGKMPAGSLMTFAGVDPVVANYPAYVPGVTYQMYQPVSVNYVNPVTAVATMSYFVRSHLYLDTTGNLVNDTAALTPPNAAYWIPALPVPNPPTPISTPVLLDAWGNPIIVVLGGSLGSLVALNADGTIPPGKGILKAGDQTFRQHSPDYRPFFASAGPDGDFSKGDDNLYSFEK